MRTSHSADRQRLIKVIHVAKRELQLDEPTYRTMLRTAGGAESTTQMDIAALRRVIDQAKKAGFKVRAKVADRKQDTRPEARKVRALWLFLHELGIVRNPSESALAAYIKRTAKVDDLHWADGNAMRRLIETLKRWAMRFLPAINTAMRDEAMRLQGAGQLGQAQQDSAARAAKAMNQYGFEDHWSAWCFWCAALGRTVPSVMSTELESRA